MRTYGTHHAFSAQAPKERLDSKVLQELDGRVGCLVQTNPICVDCMCYVWNCSVLQLEKLIKTNKNT
jgi:hypothetical protein